MKKVPQNHPATLRNPPKYFSTALIARATGASKKTVHRTAVRDRWPMRQRANFHEYQVPHSLRAKCLQRFLCTKPAGLNGFAIGTARRAEIGRAQHRFAALCALEAELLAVPNEIALASVSKAFHANPISLRQWAEHFSKRGFAGLLENKRGNSGKWIRK